MLDGANHLAGVGVLVVIPGNNLNESLVTHRKNLGLSCIEDGTSLLLMISEETISSVLYSKDSVSSAFI